MSRLPSFLEYHRRSMVIGDVDPQNACLKYISTRYELNTEQRFWLAFLFGCCYSAPTVFYIYNEFPDFENVDVGRLQRWWDSKKHSCIFQTDRLRVKTQNRFVETFESYRALIGERSQERAFFDAAGTHGVGSRTDMYRAAWDFGINIRNFGRFSMFIYLELVHELTNYKMQPNELDVKNALSSRNGLCYAMDLDRFIDLPLNRAQIVLLEGKFQELLALSRETVPSTTAWSLETVLCAYKKHVRGKRYVGYYLDRQHKEISTIESRVISGVDWSVLWDYRRETYKRENLKEAQ